MDLSLKRGEDAAGGGQWLEVVVKWPGVDGPMVSSTTRCKDQFVRDNGQATTAAAQLQGPKDQRDQKDQTSVSDTAGDQVRVG
jgi:hypothetical protein